MKFTWEEADIRGGRQMQKPDCGITGRLMVGYQTSTKGSFYGLVSLADGMWIGLGTKVDVAEYLNKCGYYDPVDLDVRAC